MKTIYKNPKPIRDPIKFACFLEAETEKAFMIDSHDFKEAVWVPKSQVLTYKLATKPDEVDEIYISQWIAEVKGLIEDSPTKPAVTSLKGQAREPGSDDDLGEPECDDDLGEPEWDDDIPF
jgi:hypothetical protein